MTAAGTVVSVFSRPLCRTTVAAGLRAAEATHSASRHFATCIPAHARKPARNNSPFDRHVICAFRGSDEEPASSIADDLVRQPLPTSPEDQRNSRHKRFAEEETEEDTLNWNLLSREEKKRLYAEVFLESVDPTYFKPELIQPQYNCHVGTLTAWGYKPTYLELWLDFAQRAAVAMKIPCSAIEQLPDAVKRWSLLKSQTTHKVKDTVEWRRYYRQIQIFDAHPEVIDRWLYYTGANASREVKWHFDRITYDELGVGKRMYEEAMREEEERQQKANK